MQQKMGGSKTGSIEEAVRGFEKPDFLLMIVSDKEVFGEKVEELAKRFPGVPHIACVGQGYYGTEVVEKGIIVISLEGVNAVANVLTNVSSMPLKRIAQLEQDAGKIGGNGKNTVCIDFCSSNDECVVATLNAVLRRNEISLTGGTAWEGLVAANGVVYEDACAYAFIQNRSGKVKVYKENIYIPTESKHVVTKADPNRNMLYELDGKPIVDVYKSEVSVSAAKIEEQTFVNPLGRVIGDDIYIISLKETVDNKYFGCYRKTNQMDVIGILELGDYEKIVEDTVESIRQDFSKVSAVLSINCAFRYLLFQQRNYKDTYFKKMAEIGNHAGLIGLGEHYKTQHTNQTMSCVVFE